MKKHTLLHYYVNSLDFIFHTQNTTSHSTTTVVIRYDILYLSMKKFVEVKIHSSNGMVVTKVNTKKITAHVNDATKLRDIW